MEISITEQGLYRSNSFEIMTNIKLICHTHTAVQLNGILTNKPTTLANLNLKS